ncbi:uncharacterized protein V3H82_010393 [Fundulus diaphanus]
MAAPITGFTPLLLSSLALHLLLLGPLLALTPGTVSTGGASSRWTPALRYRDAGEVNQQQQHREAGELPRGNWDLRWSRWTVVRIQREGCAGAQLQGWTLGGDLRVGAGEKRLRGLQRPGAPLLPPFPLLPGARSSGNSDGVGAAEGVERGGMGRKGVVSPPASPAFASLLPQNGKKKAVQRTKTCVQRWSAPRPHLAKRDAAGAFVHVSGPCSSPGSGERRGGKVCRGSPEVKRLLAASHVHCLIPNKQLILPANKHSLGSFPAAPACCNHPISGSSLPHTDASDDILDRIRAAKLDYIWHFPTFNFCNNGGIYETRQQPVYRDNGNKMVWDTNGSSARVDRRAADCFYLGRHNVIDLNSSGEGCGDKRVSVCMASRGVFLDCSLFGCRIVKPKGARITDEGRGDGREVNDLRGGGGVDHVNKHVNLSNYPDNDLVFPSPTRGKSVPATRQQSTQTQGERREVTGGCFSCLGRKEMGPALVMAPKGGMAQMNLLIQFALNSIAEMPGRQVLSNKRAVMSLTQTDADNYSKRVKQAKKLHMCASKVEKTSEAEPASDSGFFLTAKIPGAVSATTCTAAERNPFLRTQPNHTIVKYVSFPLQINLTTQQGESLFHSAPTDSLHHFQ